jgi:cell pole-organizing protein PopZ
MGKPESGPPSGQSVEQLLSSIRQAIEADSRADSVPRYPEPAPGTAPAAPAMRPPQPVQPQPAAPARVSVATVLKPQFVEKKPPPAPMEPDLPAVAKPAGPAETDDVTASRRYSSGNPYRFRYSLEGSQTYMSLRNRLSSLGARTRADTGRSMASLLGGDVRQEEARARQHRQPAAGYQDEPPLLRSSLPPEETYVEDYAAAELVSGSVSYSPDYHEWSMEQSFDEYATPVALPGTQPAIQQPVASQTPGHEPEPAAYEPEQPPAEYYAEAESEIAHQPDPEPEPASPLHLDAMIRAVIEPELAQWFDEHLPDHVARAMPDEEAFIAMIRPLIEDWLADNLAPIVEQAVKDEIARITGLKR